MIPHDSEAEECVIGSCLISRQAIPWSLEWLKPGDFHSFMLARAFSAIATLHANGLACDAVTVAEQMRREGYKEASAATLLAIQSNTPAVSSLARYGEIVRRKSAARAGLLIATTAVAGFQDPKLDADELIDSLRAELGSIDAHVPAGDPLGFATFEDLRSRPAAERSDWVIPGLLRRDWRSLLVGVEGAGKTLLLRQLAVAAAMGQHPFASSAIPPVRTLIVDLENPEHHLIDWVDRLCAVSERFSRKSEGRGAVWHRPAGIDLRKRADRGQLEEVIRRHKPDLVCLGPLYKAFRRRSERETDEDAAMDTQVALDDLRTRHGFALVIEHHAPKAQQGRRDLVPFGSSAWMRWGELRWALTPPDASFPVMSMRLVPYSGIREAEHSWPNELQRSTTGGMPWTGRWDTAPEDF